MANGVCLEWKTGRTIVQPARVVPTNRVTMTCADGRLYHRTGRNVLTLTEVTAQGIYVKRGEGKTFVIVDAGMNDLVRPTLYDAHHEIRPVRQSEFGAPRIIADVVGPVCESGDFIALDRRDSLFGYAAVADKP